MKKSVSQKTAGKIGLIGSISLIIATVVGVGVFFKNGSVFKNNNDNAWGVLISWILAIIIALFTAFSFAEIVTVKGMKNPNAGLAGWSEKMVGYNFGRHVSLTQSVFYYPAKFVAMATFGAVAIFEMYFTATAKEDFRFHADLLGVDDKYTTLIVMGVALGLIAIFMFANFLSNKFGGVVSKGATFVKFIPIIMIILIGIIVGALMGGGLWHIPDVPPNTNAVIETVSKGTPPAPEVSGIFKSIPAILFAFDSFLIIGNVQKNVENPEKNVPLAIIISMIIAAAFQMLITIGCITIGTGNPFDLLRKALDTNGGYANCHWAYMLCVIILSVSIVIATLGVINSYSMAGTKATQALVDDKVVFGHKWASKLSAKTPNLGGFVIYSIFILLIFFAVAIPSCILNTSHIYDGFSTLAVLFYFAIYGTTILGGLINRKTHKNQVHKVGYFIPFGIIAVIGCYFAFGYCVFYQFSVQVIQHPDLRDANSFGFAMVREGYNHMLGLKNWEAATVFWSAAIFFLGYPFVNDLLIKLTDKKYAQPLLWQKAKRSVSIKSR
mgnify:CR=1 FL=1